VTIESALGITADPSGHRVQIGPATTLFSPTPIRPQNPSAGNAGKAVLEWPPVHVPAGEEKTLALGVLRGPQSPRPEPLYPISADQAREIKKGLPAFQVGPTCYRGLWVVDGSFLMEVMDYLGRIEEARNGIRYLLSFQRPDGAIMLIDGHLKETGIALWAVTRHARLTGDKTWLAEVWPQIEKGFACIRPQRNCPKRIVVHTSARSGTPETFELGPQGRVEREIMITR
jgi:hypothetical protein